MREEVWFFLKINVIRSYDQYALTWIKTVFRQVELLGSLPFLSAHSCGFMHFTGLVNEFGGGLKRKINEYHPRRLCRANEFWRKIERRIFTGVPRYTNTYATPTSDTCRLQGKMNGTQKGPRKKRRPSVTWKVIFYFTVIFVFAHQFASKEWIYKGRIPWVVFSCLFCFFQPVLIFK